MSSTSERTVPVEVRGGYFELHAGEFSDAKAGCIYHGPDPSNVDPEIVPNDAPVTVRRQDRPPPSGALP